ncbi:MAG TPA: M48 family metalloprotease [Puia sp.]|jgi:hypothetical protein
MLPQALPYQLKVRDYFKQQASTWEWFAAARTREEQLVSFQTELLKNTYQFRRGTDTALYEKIDLVREKLGLGDLPVAAYQAQNANDPELNASIVYLHREAHLVFSGPILERLNETELLAVIAHELTHIRLYTLLDGDLEVADRIITAIANNYNSEPCYYETARLFRLYTEIFCDRGAYAVLGDAAPVITSLVKLATGLAEVNAESYTLQAEAVFSAEPGTQSVTPTHPENFIRARALRLWHEAQGVAATAGSEATARAEEAIVRMIEGKPELDRLDLFSQRELNELTVLFLQEYLRPEWMQSTLVMGLVREYFPNGLAAERVRGGVGIGQGDGTGGSIRGEDGGEVAEIGRDRLVDTITGAHSSIRDYFAYVLLDFALADPSLEEMPAGRAFEFAGEMQLTAAYDPLYKKELQLSEKKWQQHKQKVLDVYTHGNKPHLF